MRRVKKINDFLENLGKIKSKKEPEQIIDQKIRFFNYTYPSCRKFRLRGDQNYLNCEGVPNKKYAFLK